MLSLFKLTNIDCLKRLTNGFGSQKVFFIRWRSQILPELFFLKQDDGKWIFKMEKLKMGRYTILYFLS